jgi:penicillin amidase
MDIRKILVWFLLLAAMVFLCLRLIFIPSYASSLQYKGETITIIRDQYNVPHVKALSGSGALYGLGYATAEDRLFQMYIKKMIAEGRLSEIFGNRSLTVDRILRTVGLAYWAK